MSLYCTKFSIRDIAKNISCLRLCLNAFNPTFQNSQAARPKTARTDANYALFLAEVEKERLQHPSIPRMNSKKNPLPVSSSTYFVMKKDLDHWGYAKLQVCIPDTVCNKCLLYLVSKNYDYSEMQR